MYNISLKQIKMTKSPYPSLYGTARFQKCKQLLEYPNYLLLRDIWRWKFYSIFKFCSFFQHQC